MAKKKQQEMTMEEAVANEAGDDDIYDPELDARKADAAATQSATLAAIQARQKAGCVMPEKLLVNDTVGSVPPGTTGYIDPHYVGVDIDKRVYLYARAPLSREPARSGPALIKVMRTHMGWTVYALAFTGHRWTPNAVLWPFASEADIIPVFQLQA